MSDDIREVQEAHSAIPSQADYFGVDEVHRFMLPDRESWVEHKTMTEGDRRKFLKQTNKNVKLDKRGEATIQVAPGEERAALITAALCGWNLKSNGIDVAFAVSSVNRFLEQANPKIVDLIEKDIRTHNPWLMNEMTVEGIDEEMDRLVELRAEIVEQEAGNATS